MSVRKIVGFPKKTKRGRQEIYAAVLVACRTTPLSATVLCRKANLDYPTWKAVLSELQRYGYISFSEFGAANYKGRNGVFYVASEFGKRFLLEREKG